MGSHCRDKAIQGPDGDQEGLHHPCLRLLSRLLLPAASSGGICAAIHGHQGHRRRQFGVPLRTVPVLHGMDHRVALCQSSRGLRPTRQGHHRKRGKPRTGSRTASRANIGTDLEGGGAVSTPLVMFLVFIAITLGITYWASKRSVGSSAYFAAGRRITGWQNGIAVAGDYMSAASFLGIAGIIAFQGYDGFLFSVGWLVAYLTVLLIVAEPLRNAGRYTMADVLAYRLKPRPVRAMASLSTLTVSTVYMIAQMVGAGVLVSVLLKDSGINYKTAVIGV